MEREWKRQREEGRREEDMVRCVGGMWRWKLRGVWWRASEEQVEVERRERICRCGDNGEKM